MFKYKNEGFILLIGLLQEGRKEGNVNESKDEMI